ncbi:unnamed protein product [marine sediment metagenome]|uniref:Uncharacterized protein n=1 Tax=marine sediment metagenome TaxID=412755 RepID=X1L437_9ZZZZ
MVSIHNSDLKKEIIEGAKIQLSVDNVPQELGKTVVPVMEVNPKFFRKTTILKSGTTKNDTSLIILTTPKDRDFYITSACISLIKDVTSTSTFSGITLYEASNPTQVKTILEIAGITLTAQTANMSLNFPNPIKVARGTQIIMKNETGVAEIKAMGGIHGFYVED